MPNRLQRRNVPAKTDTGRTSLDGRTQASPPSRGTSDSTPLPFGPLGWACTSAPTGASKPTPPRRRQGPTPTSTPAAPLHHPPDAQVRGTTVHTETARCCTTNGESVADEHARPLRRSNTQRSSTAGNRPDRQRNPARHHQPRVAGTADLVARSTPAVEAHQPMAHHHRPRPHPDNAPVRDIKTSGRSRQRQAPNRRLRHSRPLPDRRRPNNPCQPPSGADSSTCNRVRRTALIRPSWMRPAFRPVHHRMPAGKRSTRNEGGSRTPPTTSTGP